MGKKQKKQKKNKATKKNASSVSRGKASTNKDVGQRNAEFSAKKRDYAPKYVNGRVPTAEAFQKVKRRPPPSHLPGWQEEAGTTVQPEMSVEAPKNSSLGKKAQKNKNAKPKKTSSKNAKPKTQKPQKPKKQLKPANPAKRRKRRMVVMFFALIVLIAVGVWFSLTVLFKIKNYDIEGKTQYSKEEIVAAFGHEIGENLLAFNATSEQKRIEQALPYIETVVIRRRLPDTVVFRVTPAVEAYYFEKDDEFVVLSGGLKVLRFANEAPKGLIEIRGLSDVGIVSGLLLEDLDIDEKVKSEKPSSHEASSLIFSLPVRAKSEAIASEGAQSLPQSSAPQSQQVQTPAEGEETPAEGEEAPAEGEEAPAEGEEAPAEGEEAPAEGEETPAEGEQTPQSENKQQTSSSAHADDAALFTGVDDANAVKTSSLQALQALIEGATELGLSEISWVDVTNPVDLRISWQNRVVVKIGSKSNLKEKVKFIKALLVDEEKMEISSEARGTLDVSAYPDNMDRVWFKPE